MSEAPPADPMPPPWHGDTIPVPNYINGNPVVAAVATPTVAANSPQQWVAIVHDTKEQFFTIWHVGWNGGYIATSPEYGFGFFDALIELARITGLAPDSLEVQESTVASDLTVNDLYERVNAADGDWPVAIESGAGYWTVEEVTTTTIDGKRHLVLAVGEFIASVPTDQTAP